MTLFTKRGRRYVPADKHEVCEAAATYLAEPLVRGSVMQNPRSVREFLQMLFAPLDYESFTVLFLDNRHRLIAAEGMFRGTVDGASVHPREVVREVMKHNAAAVILAHNHPSGNPEPSQADELITERLKDALALIDVRVLDHLVVGKSGIVSFAERGLI